jgi:myo-inositol-1-phosphate synthase
MVSHMRFLQEYILEHHPFCGRSSVGFYKTDTVKKCQTGWQRMPKVTVALIGIGNCASAFIQGLQYYGKLEKPEDCTGLRNPKIGGLAPKDIQVVAGFDVDERKVGRDLAEAIFAKPNNAPRMAAVSSTGIIVNKGRLLDGVGESTKKIVQVSDKPDSDVARILKESGAEVVINLLPSGAAEASRWYAEQALQAGCAFVNATPNFIASDSSWAKRFVAAGVPLVGDDLVDQIGSTALHKTLLQLLSLSGVKISETYQLDVGGGTESLDTLDRTRDAKRLIKTESVASSLPYKAEVVAGSTDYVDFLQNKRDSYFWISGIYFGNAPLQMDLKFSTVDAPNAGSVLFDVVRAVKIALGKKQKGAINAVCAYGFKHPPKMLPLGAAEEEFKKFTTE